MIPLNNLTFDILSEIYNVGYCHNPDDYDYDCFSDLYPCENLNNEDKLKIIIDYLSNNIEILDVITDYYDLEKSYEENVLIIKYKGKLLGINYFSSPGIASNLDTDVKFIDDLPEYEEVQITTYQEKC